MKGELHMELKKRNAEGYMDPTAYTVMRSIITMRLRQTLKPVSLSSLRVVCDYIPK